MMSKEFLKRVGIFGVAIGLTASPFALAHAWTMQKHLVKK
ncbi:hypothetical protein Q427_23175 [Halomonas sp. BC04]|nr:hypothetical protein Q427_23175 [Halomonas sp. BC04]